MKGILFEVGNFLHQWCLKYAMKDTYLLMFWHVESTQTHTISTLHGVLKFTSGQPTNNSEIKNSMFFINEILMNNQEMN